MFLFRSCCGGNRRRKEQEESQPDETTRLLATSDALFPQVAEAPKPIDDEALLEYQRRIDKILEETAEKLISVNSPTNALVHTQSEPSSSGASSSTTRPSEGQGHHHGRTGSNGQYSNGRDTIWRAEPGTENSVYSMKKVAKSAKAKGKQVAASTDLLSPSDDDDGSSKALPEHDRDATYASYKTAQQQEDAETDGGQYTDRESSVNGTADHDEAPSSEAASATATPARQGHRPVHAKEIFTTSSEQQRSLAKEKTQERLQKALTMSDDDFAKHLTQR